ncbi:MAG: 50S ribosomal protein L24e [Candidatus Methanomethylicia archaeon]|nr:50S ribosomal protein L24e [Candidatus Methanomethylicia archaeon]MCX8169067.1 50S ribosomal protein L24e [Candidatus Methanomethylicia archaeon]MDW7988799.1 50S ribosomal protein L24e [Nitrososphaerota archaeon]
MSIYIRRCSFCGKDVPKGRGMLYVKSDGTVLFFCSSKCRKNMLYFSRKPGEVKWVVKTKKESI